MNTAEVGRRLVALCKEGKNRQAIEELYADHVDVQEAMQGGPYPNGVRSRQDLLAASDWFFSANEIHDASVDGPYPKGDRFICFMSIDMTGKEGPMAGQRMKMQEAAEYHVKNGKITATHYFYDVGEDCNT